MREEANDALGGLLGYLEASFARQPLLVYASGPIRVVKVIGEAVIDGDRKVRDPIQTNVGPSTVDKWQYVGQTAIPVNAVVLLLGAHIKL